MICPCSSGSEFSKCCEANLADPKRAETAEALMRARYAAYTLQKMDFLQKTHDPKTISKYDLKAATDWSESADWLGLEIISTKEGQAGDKTGWVHFRASYAIDGGEDSHEEISEFCKKGDRWLYTSGVGPDTEVSGEKRVEVKTVVNSEPKVGRNDPCPCDSGKKYKKCCGV